MIEAPVIKFKALGLSTKKYDEIALVEDLKIRISHCTNLYLSNLARIERLHYKAPFHLKIFFVILAV